MCEWGMGMTLNEKLLKIKRHTSLVSHGIAPRRKGGSGEYLTLPVLELERDQTRGGGQFAL